MIKKDYRLLIVTTVVCLIPIVFGLAVYHQLPEQMAIHWGANGEADGFASKLVGAILLPLLLAGINIITQLFIYNDPKRHNFSKRLFKITVWTIPAVAMIIQPISILIALGVDIKIEVIVPILVGTLLVILGNYMPKCKQNYTMGIRIPWTLASEENWRKTHRIAGFVYVFAGIVMIFNTLLLWVDWVIMLIIIVGVMLVIPIGYSFLYYRKTKNMENF